MRSQGIRTEVAKLIAVLLTQGQKCLHSLPLTVEGAIELPKRDDCKHP